MRSPLLVDIKSNSLDDGPGIRSVVFFKGCPLSCVWCHNPETASAHAELSFDRDACIGSRECVGACPEAALRADLLEFVDRERCTLCWECLDVCPSRALSRVGESVTLDELVGRLLVDKAFYDNSGGGVTLSGGEPTWYLDFLGGLLRQLRQHDVHALLQTCGAFDLARFDELVYPVVSLIYFDLKLFDPRAHFEYCGASNEVILDNFRELYRRVRAGGVPVLPRVPLVPGLTDTDTNLSSIVTFLRQEKVGSVQLVEYNPLWPSKSARLGLLADKRVASAGWHPSEELARCRAHFLEVGIELV